MGEHAILSASSAHRWMNCPGSIRLSAGVEKTTTDYAEEGSAAHYLAEHCLRKGKDAKHFEGRLLRKLDGGFSILQISAAKQDGDFEIDEEMATAVQTYLDTIREDQDSRKGAELRIETRFDLSGIYPGLFGTNDASLAEPFGKLTVYDYKHGAGYAVDAVENPQLMYYALGASNGEDFEEIELVIVQPRARHKDGTVRRWSLPAADLSKWVNESLIPAAKATEAPDAPANPGDWCRFCPAMAICPAMRNLAVETAKSDFATIPLPAPDALGIPDLVKVLQSSEILKSWLRSVEGYAEGMLKRGETVPGFKLVRKKTNRRWIDEQKVISRFVKFNGEIFEKKLMSPAKLEKWVVKKGLERNLDEFIERPEGELTIAPESDRREAVSVCPALDFLADEDFLQ